MTNNNKMFFEGMEVDMSSEFSTYITFKIDDISHFGDRDTSVSKTVILPGTARNNKTLGHIFLPEVENQYSSTAANVGNNFNPSVSAKVVIFQNHIQVFKGIASVMNIIDHNGKIEYELGLWGEFSGIVLKMGNKKLQDLDFSEHDMQYTVANILASWDSINGSGVYFPLIDYGGYSFNGSTKNDWDIRTLRPALYTKEYIDKIFAAAGYTYECDLFNTSRFKSLIHPHNSKGLTKLSADVLRLSNTTPYVVLDSGGMFNYIGWPSFIGPYFTQSNVNQKYTYNNANALTMITTVNMSGVLRGSGKNFQVAIYKNGDYVPGSLKNYSGGPTESYWSYVHTVNIALATNDYIEVGVLANGVLGSIDYFHLTAGSLSGDSTIPVVNNIAIGDTISINSMIPKNELQKDFFVSILKLWNLYVTEDKYTENLLHIKPFVDFYSGVDEDWTHKLNRKVPKKYKPMSEMSYRFYEFKYAQDSDYYNELYFKRYGMAYGSYKFDSEYELSKEKAELEVMFAGTPLVGYVGEDKVFSTIFKKSITTEEQIDSKMRILQAKKITGVNSWNIMDDATILTTVDSYGYAGHLDDPDAPTNDIGFGVPFELFFSLVAGALHVNQFNTYYSSYMAEITSKDSKMLTANFFLSEADIFNLDMSKYVIVDNVRYRKNKIIDYNASRREDCQVELLKVINTNY